ncbi:hypothetical protein AB0H43_31295 [Hamadaea sp. NPDC050747]|uniref:hypothetical protein n=1 Tax=Hamadaea sp. NPDC050747 TaxID=3155789 RepID=UPI00340CD0CE
MVAVAVKPVLDCGLPCGHSPPPRYADRSAWWLSAVAIAALASVYWFPALNRKRVEVVSDKRITFDPACDHGVACQTETCYEISFVTRGGERHVAGVDKIRYGPIQIRDRYPRRLPSERLPTPLVEVAGNTKSPALSGGLAKGRAVLIEATRPYSTTSPDRDRSQYSPDDERNDCGLEQGRARRQEDEDEEQHGHDERRVRHEMPARPPTRTIGPLCIPKEKPAVEQCRKEAHEPSSPRAGCVTDHSHDHREERHPQKSRKVLDRP